VRIFASKNGEQKENAIITQHKSSQFVLYTKYLDTGDEVRNILGRDEGGDKHIQNFGQTSQGRRQSKRSW
jgi:hypothetical protein